MTTFGRGFLLFSCLFIALPGPVAAGGGESFTTLFERARIPPLKKPKPAHPFTLPDINGSQVSLGNLRGKIVFLNVWATWCAPCRKEMPSIERLHQHFAGQDLVVLTVSVDIAEVSRVKAFVDKHGYTFPVLHDPRGDIMDWFGVRLIPVTYLIDKSGRIVGKAVGPREWCNQDMIRLFEALERTSETE
jgi:peroxiredoxin